MTSSRHPSIEGHLSKFLNRWAQQQQQSSSLSFVLDFFGTADDHNKVWAACGNISSLTKLKIQRVVSIPSLATCTSLTDLEIGNCTMLTSIQPISSLTALSRLSLSCLSGLKPMQRTETFNSIMQLTSIRDLTIHGYTGLRTLVPIAALGVAGQLRLLDISDCSCISSVGPLSACTSLQFLCMSGLKNVKKLEPLIRCSSSLTHLDISGCSKISDILPLLGSASSLTHLDITQSGIRNCRITPSSSCVAPLLHLVGVSSFLLAKMARITTTLLQELVISDYTDELTPLTMLSSLQKLVLRYDHITTLQPMSSLVVLEHLDMRSCLHVSSMQPLEMLTGLTYLNMHECVRISGSLQPLGGMIYLRHLDIEGCKLVADLGPLQACSSLTYLNARSISPAVSTIGALEACTALTHLDLHNSCRGVSSLGPLRTLNALTYLNLSIYPSNCHNSYISTLEPLSTCTSLEHLMLGNSFNEVSTLEPLSTLCALTHLTLSHSCSKITTIEPLSSCVSLRYLDICGCTGISSLEPLNQGCVDLNIVNVTNCPIEWPTGSPKEALLSRCTNLDRLYTSFEV